MKLIPDEELFPFMNLVNIIPQHQLEEQAEIWRRRYGTFMCVLSVLRWWFLGKWIEKKNDS